MELWGRVVQRWRDEGVCIRAGNSPQQLAAFEKKYRVALPGHVREYLSITDGTGDDFDQLVIRFWPLCEIKPVDEVLVSDRCVYPDRYAYPGCFVFADFCVSCWAYALKLTEDSEQPAPVYRIGGGELVASSFFEFMTRYADDPKTVL